MNSSKFGRIQKFLDNNALNIIVLPILLLVLLVVFIALYYFSVTICLLTIIALPSFPVLFVLNLIPHRFSKYVSIYGFIVLYYGFVVYQIYLALEANIPYELLGSHVLSRILNIIFP